MSLPEIVKTKNHDQYTLVTTEAELATVCEEMQAANLISVDTETWGLNHDDVIAGVCLSTKAGTGYYIPLRHEVYDGVLFDNQLAPPVVFAAIGPILEEKPCVGHNIKFDAKMLWKDGVDCNFVADTLAIAKLFGNYHANGLKFLIKEIFEHDMADLASLFPKKGNKKAVIAPGFLSPEEICHYAAEDANWTLQLYQHFIKQYPRLLTNPLFRIEMKLLPSVGEMEAFGLPVSKPFLEEHGVIAREIISILEDDIIDHVRERLGDPEYTISLTSPIQLSKLLFDDLLLPVLAKSKTTDKPSASKEVLEQLADIDPITRSIHTHRTLKKLNSTYLEGLVGKIYPDARIRGNFNQFGTSSGRFSSSNPNLQNLPRDQTFYLWRAANEVVDLLRVEFADKLRERGDTITEGMPVISNSGEFEVYDEQKSKWGKKGELGVASNGKTYGVEDNRIKEMWKCKTRNFVAARPGYYLVEADYSQVELRIMAGESQEPTLLAAYLNGDDVHTATAAVVFDVPDCGVAGCESKVHPLCLVSEEQRQSGKTINFSLLYGAGADNIGKQLGISLEEAEELVARYFEKLPNIGIWIQAVKRAAIGAGMAATPFGRVRHFPHIRKDPRGPDRQMVSKEQREAVNFKIQGAAADVMKFALVRTAKRLRDHFGDEAKMVSTVHDSVLLEVHESISRDDVARVLNASMTGKDFLEAIQCSQRACREHGHGQPGCQVKWPALEIDIKMGLAWADAKKHPFPEDMTLPPLYEGELPRVRVQQVAVERDLGLTRKTEEINIFTGETIAVVPVYSADHVAWVIEVPKPLNVAQTNGLVDFLRERNSTDAKGTLKLVVPDTEGFVTEKHLQGTFFLTMEDEMTLRIKIGTCTLRQELGDIDPDEVLRGIDFDI